MQGVPRKIGHFDLDHRIMQRVMGTLCDHNNYQECENAQPEEREEYPSTIKILAKYGYPVNEAAELFGVGNSGHVTRWCHGLSESVGWLDFELIFSEDSDPEKKAEEEKMIANSLQWCLCYSFGWQLYTDDSEQYGKQCTWTPLQYAAALGRERAVQALLECGADLSIKDEEGHTALDLARISHRNEVVEILTNWSAEV